MEFVRLEQEGLALLKQWFQDPEALRRLSGMLPLERWLPFVLQNPDYYAWIVYESGQPVGQIDAETEADGTAYVSLLVNPGLRGRGYGSRMLAALLQRPELTAVRRWEAGIEPDNIASIRCFRKAGFVEQEVDEDGFMRLVFIPFPA
ncbi:GNAT family N-acetyltransferase [Paenibacillus flagellatus]|uniref:GNAT family N-acetyltransferase n=1 Tax=Paenibacillus flagellatus TaxID=2211139 RepID=UPI00130545CF|nr:GNAT family N-acetyltransferase [Paenibacillus flagellatus]